MRYWCVLLFVLVLSGTAWAQAPTGGIEGTVTDPTSAVIPGAKVTITETGTGRNIQLTTNESGRYSVSNLLPGQYRISIEAPNFSRKVIDNVTVNAGAVVNGDTQLQVGRTEETVSVTAEAVMVDTVRHTVDTVVTAKEIQNIPQLGRNFLDLAALAPGVTVRDGESIDPTKAIAYRTVGIAGRSGTGTRVQIDGVDVTDETVGTTTSNISSEAVSEFQLTRSSLDPSTSLTSSGAVSIITRSGSNDIHGSWFWNYFNQDMGARLEYNKEAAPFKRNQTGGWFGGPLVKNKLFWFANWERTYQTSQEVFTTPQFPQLNVSQGFPVGIRMASGRMDWNISDTLRAFYRFQHDWNLATGGTPPSPFQNINWTNMHTAALNWTRPRSTHSYRFGYVNFNNNIASQELSVKFPRVNGLPYYLAVGAFQAGPNGLAPQQTFQDNFQNSYDGSAVFGRHTLRFGTSFTHIALGGFANFAGPLSVSGTYDTSTIAAVRARGGNVQDPLEYPFEGFTTGPQSGFFMLRAGHGLQHGDHLNNRFAWYVQDSLKLARTVTLNVGLRWQYDSGFFPNDHRVKRDPNMERWGRGFSKFPDPPKNLFSPSLGFAWDVRGNGKTVVRAGFYKAYEMNISNNILFDEFAMLPAGIGPDIYDYTFVTGPDGKPIDVGGFPDGDYSSLEGRPLKDVIATIGRVHQALQAAYQGAPFDPSKGTPLFTSSKGVTFGGQLPGNQFKVPYALQWNIGVQRELRPGFVLTADYIENRGVGLPFFLIDFERRRDAGTLNAVSARTQVNRVLGGQTVDQWIAANPTRTISAFGLVNDTIWQGVTGTDFNRARFFQGGFTRYRGLQLSLRGSTRNLGRLRDISLQVGYAFARGESSAASDRPEFLTTPYDNRNWNNSFTFGPTALDFTHTLGFGSLFTIPGGFRFNQITRFRTPRAQTLTVPNLGGAISGTQGFFGTDINGDGGTGTTPRSDVLPTLAAGEFGRKVKSLKDANKAIQAFNDQFAGKLTPHGQALVAAGLFTEAQLRRLGAVTPSIPLIPTNNPDPWHNLFVTDLRFDRPIHLPRLREGMELIPFVNFFNLFNHAPPRVYGGLRNRFGDLNFDYAAAGSGEKASDLDAFRHRLNDPRRVEIGVRFNF